ncbi:MAG TPA: cytochrome P450 [Nevskiaceae bacterium]|nr:cytochrome P450 [Nevskiaceae bacterium]
MSGADHPNGMPFLPECSLDGHGRHGEWQYVAMHAAQARGRLATLNGLRTFIRHEDVLELLKDGQRLREPGMDWLRSSGITGGPVWDWWQHILYAHQREKHRRLRTLVSKAFAAHNVHQLRQAVVRAVGCLGDELQARGTFEARADFASRVPAHTIAHFLGIPEADIPVFARWASDLGQVFSLRIAAEARQRLDVAIVELSDYVHGLIAERRRRPQQDLITALIGARDEDDRLSDVELVALVANIVLGGYDTTRCALTSAFFNLSRHPDQWRLLKYDPTRVETAVEETLRKDPPVAWLLRVVTQPFAFRDLRLEPGETIVLSVLAANHDRSRFASTERFDVTRPVEPSLSFGIGPHFCIGSWVARMQLQESVRMLVARFSELCCLEGEVTWSPLLEFRGPAQLHVSVAVA